MGGVGSGRPPNVENLIAQKQNPIANAGDSIFLPNYSGVKKEALKTSSEDIKSNWTASGSNIYNSNSGNVGIGTTTIPTKLTIAQSADNNGLRIYGYDDKAADYGELFLDSSGYFNIQTGGTRSIVLNVPSGAALFFKQAGGEIVRMQSSRFQLPDNGVFGLGDVGAASNDYGFGYNATSDNFEIVDGSTIGTNVRMVINNAGNVGIGTTSPNAKLHLSGNSGVSVQGIQIQDTSEYTPSNWYIGPNYAAGKLNIRDMTEGAIRMTIDGGGNIGIGTTAPLTKLEVVGTISGSSMYVGTALSGSSIRVLSDDDVSGSAVCRNILVGTEATPGPANLYPQGTIYMRYTA